MNAKDLKKYIYENEKIEFVLENIGCHSIQYHPHYKKPYYSCANFDGDNPTAVNVFDNAYLNVRNWTRQSDFSEKCDIFTLVQYNKDLSFKEAIKYLHSILGLTYSYSKKDIVAMKTTDEEECLEDYPEPVVINVLEESVLKNYEPLLYVDWVKKDGILDPTRKKFGIMYSYEEKCIVIPHRYWRTGELVGLNKRTTVEFWEELGFSKYRLTSGYDKAHNIYGLWENREDIEKAGYVVVVESEKSVLKRDTRLDPTLVALSGKFMSEEQRRILLELDVQEIVIALDKDVPQREVWNMCEKLWKDRKVSYIYDQWDILGEKDSPADAHMKNYDFLFENRICYNEDEHQKYEDTFQKRVSVTK